MYFWHNKHIHIAVSSCMKTLMLSKGGSTTLWLITIENKYIFVGAYVLIPNSTYYLSYSSHKDDVIDIADPGSTHDAYHMNFVRDLAHHNNNNNNNNNKRFIPRQYPTVQRRLQEKKLEN